MDKINPNPKCICMHACSFFGQPVFIFLAWGFIKLWKITWKGRLCFNNFLYVILCIAVQLCEKTTGRAFCIPSCLGPQLTVNSISVKPPPQRLPSREVTHIRCPPDRGYVGSVALGATCSAAAVVGSEVLWKIEISDTVLALNGYLLSLLLRSRIW